MSSRIFGTDGIRGRAGEGWLRPEGASAVGRAVGSVLLRGGVAGPPRALALLGHDGRRSGPGLMAAVAHGLASSGCSTVSAGLITTPGLAWLALRSDCEVAVMISASHNPADDNGIKVFGRGGEKLSDLLELAIEERLVSGGAPVESGPELSTDPALARAYEDHLVESAGDLRLDGWRIALDCAHGGGSRAAPGVLRRLGASLDELCSRPDGLNINKGCGAVHPELLQSRVRAGGALLGIALDGDGDRCILVDENGKIADGDAILTLCGRHAARQRRLVPPRIAATVMSNRGLHRALREVGVSVVDTDVGDRKVVEAMRREGLLLGGEQSGHIVFGPENNYIGDGTYTALRVLRVLRESGEPLSRLAAAYQTFPQVLVNVRVGSQPPLSEIAPVASLLASIERELGDDGRVLLRYSGTEPLARVMVEGPSEVRIREQAQALAERIRAAIGA